MSNFANMKNKGKTVTLTGMWQSKKNANTFTGQVGIDDLKEAVKAMYEGSPTRRAVRPGDKVTVCFSEIPPQYRKANGPTHKTVILGPQEESQTADKSTGDDW